MKKVLAISSDLGCGGAERFLTYLLNSFVKNEEYVVELLLIKNEGNVFLSQLNENIKTATLNFSANEKLRKPKIIKLLIKILQIRPNILFVNNNSIAFFITIFAPILRLFGIKIVWRLTLLHSINCASKSWIYRKYFKYSSNLYSALITQSNDMTNDLVDNWDINLSKITQINNPIDIEKVQCMALQSTDIVFDTNYKNFVMAGRLLPQKGYDIIIERIANYISKHNIRIYIMGKGALQKELEEMIKNKNLTDTFFLLGHQSNPYAIMKQADGFILSSRHEGFPNVLLEANALGVPVFANRCPGGINEIVIEKVNGLSCDMTSQDEFNETFKTFINMNFDKNKIIYSVSERFGYSVIMPKFDKVFTNL